MNIRDAISNARGLARVVKFSGERNQIAEILAISGALFDVNVESDPDNIRRTCEERGVYLAEEEDFAAIPVVNKEDAVADNAELVKLIDDGYTKPQLGVLLDLYDASDIAGNKQKAAIITPRNMKKEFLIVAMIEAGMFDETGEMIVPEDKDIEDLND